MVRGLYTAWSGMINEQKRLDVVSNNLANSSTVGFKQDNVTNQSFEHQLMIKIKDASENFNDRPVGSMSLGVKLGEVYTNHEQGPLRQTENTYDLAMEGKGFFKLAVTDKNGNETVHYTRDGGFIMDRDGNVVDAKGNRLLGESGPITIPTDAVNVAIDTNGVIYADGNYINTVSIADIEDYNYLKKVEDTRYELADGGAETVGTGVVHQGFLEQSNIKVVSEMVNMIAITRAYEANQKIIQTIDGTLEQSANAVGKV